MRHHKTHWLFSSLLTLALVATFAAPAFADKDKDDDRPRQRRGQQDDSDQKKRDRPNHDERRKEIQEALFKGIDLTEDQQEQVRAIHQETQTAHKQWREEHKDEVDAIRAEMKQARENDDKDAMKTAREKMKTLMENAPGPQQALDRVASEVLTDGQQAQFKENREKVREKMESRRKQHHDRAGRNQGDDDDDNDDDRPQRRNKKRSRN